MKTIRIPLLLATICALVAACAGPDPESPDDANELVWAIADADAQQPAVDAWNEANPDVPVRVEELPEEADGQRQQLRLELDAEGAGFDVLGLDIVWTGELAQEGWLEPLEDLRDEVEGELMEPALASAEWDDTLWALPYNTNAALLYYRTDLVDEPPASWQELVEVGTQAAQEAGIYAYVGQGAQYEGLVVNYLEYLWSLGGDLYTEDGSEIVFADDPAAVEALEFMQQRFADGFYSAGFNTMQEEDARVEFQQGEVVFMRNWPYAYGLLSGEVDEDPSEVADVFDIAPLPSFDGEESVSALGGFNNAVSVYSQRKEEALEFVRFVATDEGVQTALAETAIPPVLESVYEDLGDDPVMSMLADILPDARPRPPVPEWTEVSVEMQQQLFPAYNGEAEATEAVEGIRVFMEDALAGREEAEEAEEADEGDEGQ